MIQFNFTPLSGEVVLNGKYSYDKSITDDEYRGDIAEFQIVLSWNSDMLMSSHIKRIIWLDPIPFDDARIGEEKIRDAYLKLNKKPVVLMKDNINETL